MEKQEEVEEGFSVLPQEMIFQILKELPVKSLLRLRCVSKLWCSIIDDPFFVHSHHIRSYSRPGAINIIIFCHGFNKLYSPNPVLYSADPEGHELHHILNLEARMIYSPHQLVNGLVRIEDWIWNPSTRECIDIPPISVTVTLQYRRRLKLYPEYFLGYDPSTMKYKVLGRCHITTKRGYRRGYRVDGPIEYKILTLGSNSWRDIVDDSIPQQLNVNEFECDASTCYIDGVIYCLNSLHRYPNESSGDEQDENIILAFEVGPKKFRAMSLPSGNKYGSSLLQVGENLAVMDKKLTTIWILEDYEKQLWNKESLVIMYEGMPLIDDDGAMKLPIGTIHTGTYLFGSALPFCYGHGSNEPLLCGRDQGSSGE
ncbi:putative F-box protein At4g38870 [Cornus florida]|uniref:putative F-box protein At4g38870 n=1 Tax=Cornus florida TaxID=4283 RepID=UPI0028A22FFD|nr:putative F-box protein At4g38870 [Cornus florida]